MPESRRGLVLGFASYLMWGFFPLYWPLLEPAGSAEILAHRVAWSLVTMGTVTLALRRGAALRRLVAQPRARAYLAGAAVVITLNWGGFIFGVTQGYVLQVSLGYFMNPLVSVLMGVLVLGERLRPAQWGAVTLAALAVLGLTVENGEVPWVALLLAFSFATYGLAKKKADAGAVESLTFETLLITPFALAYLLWLAGSGDSHFTTGGPWHAVLLAGTGIVTAVPLLAFGAAATRIPLSTLGLLQYVAPTIHFALGVWWFDEAMPTGKLVGFALVWVALAVFTAEALRHRRRQLRLAAEAAAI